MIFLDKIRESDLRLIADWKKNCEVTKYINSDDRLTIKEQIEWLKKIKSNDKCKYWIVNNCGIKIGILDLNYIDLERRTCTLEYYIGDMHFRKRKITPILLYNIYDYVFENMNFEKVSCSIMQFNKRAIDIHLKFGCKLEGTFKNSGYENEKISDVIYLAMTKEKWNKIKSDFDFEKIYID